MPEFTKEQIAISTGEHLAIRCILRAMIDYLDRREGGSFRADFARRCVSLMRHVPDAHLTPGAVHDSREAGIDLIESLIGATGNRVPVN